MKKTLTYIAITLLTSTIFLLTRSVFFTENSGKTASINTYLKMSNLEQFDIILFKKEQKLELWCSSDTAKYLIKTYPIQLQNNTAGVLRYPSESILPEGIYPVNQLEEDLFFIPFPNAFDQQKAMADQRNIHKKNIEIAVQTEGIGVPKKLLRTLQKIHQKGFPLRAIILPNDLRKGTIQECYQCPHWIAELYGMLQLEMRAYPSIAH